MQHKHVKSTRQITDVDGRSIFVILTDLATNPADKGFDGDAYRELENAAQEYLGQHPSYDDFRIRQTVP
jgi:hypothetical protein